MGALWRTPSERDTTKPQIEFCDLCGNACAAQDRTQGTNQDLNGKWLCKRCAHWGQDATFQDLGGPGNMAPPPTQLEPHSGGSKATYTYTVTYLSYGVSDTPNYTYLFSADFDTDTFPVKAGDTMTVTDSNLGTDEATVTSVSTTNDNEIYVLSTRSDLAGVWMDSPTLSFKRPGIFDDTEWP